VNVRPAVRASSYLRRDTARRIARHLELPTRFIESLRGVAFDPDGHSMLVRGEVDGRTACVQAIPTLGQRVAPLARGKRFGLWPVCEAVGCLRSLAIITTNLQDACDAFQAGAPTSMLVGDPTVISRMTLEHWINAIHGDLSRTIAARYADTPCIGVSCRDAKVADRVFYALTFALRLDGYGGTVILLDHNLVAGARKVGQWRGANLHDLLKTLTLAHTKVALGSSVVKPVERLAGAAAA
jgi:hypothetical protein